LDNIDIFTLNKSKTPVSTNDIETYNKEILSDEIFKLIIANVQLMTNKIKTKKTRVNLETDRIQLFGKKNSLVIKKKELQTEIVILNTTGSSNLLIYDY